jgi:hypothetical protein
MPKNTRADSKPTSRKRTLNPGQGGALPGEPGGGAKKKSDRNQMQPERGQGQFTGAGRPGLQKK